MQPTTHGEDSFYTAVRENVIALLLFLAAVGIGHWFTEEYRVKPFGRPARRPNRSANGNLEKATEGCGEEGLYDGDDAGDEYDDQRPFHDRAFDSRAGIFFTRSAESPALGRRRTLHDDACGTHSRLRNGMRSTDVDLLEAASPYYQGVLGLVPNLLCSAALAVAVSGFTLPPVTILFTGYIHSLPDRAGEWIEWLDTSLLSRLWRYTFHGIHISLFLLVPFAYFYSEADVVRGAAAKARESGLILSMTAVLGYGLIYVVKRLLDADGISDASVVEFATAGASAVLCLSISPAGFMALFSAIKRLPLRPNYRRELKDLLLQLHFEKEVVRQRMEALEPPWQSEASQWKRRRASKLELSRTSQWERSRASQWELTRRRNISEHYETDADWPAPFEPPASRTSLDYYMTPASTGSRQRSSSWAGRDSPGTVRRIGSEVDRRRAPNEMQAKHGSGRLAARMAELEKERSAALRNLGQSPLRRNLLFLALFFLSAVAWCLFVVVVTLSFVHGLLPNSNLREILHGGGRFLAEDSPSPQPGKSAAPASAAPLPTNSSPLSMLIGTELPLVDAAMVVYFCLSLAAGVLTSPSFDGLLPRPHATGTRELSGFIATVLFLASSLPFVVRILGLSASLPLPWDLDSVTDSIPGGKVLILSAYRFVMLIRTTYYMLDSVLFSNLK